jgi:hypothetical protein
MPRYLTCIDPVPASDGTCQETAWIDQGGIADMLPTVEQGNTVGMAIFGALVMLRVIGLINPRRENDE